MNLPTKLTVLRIILTFVIILMLIFPFYTVGIVWPKILIFGISVKSQILLY